MIFKGTVYVARTEWIGIRLGQLAGSFKYCNEILFTIICGNFLTSCEIISFSRRILLHEFNWL